MCLLQAWTLSHKLVERACIFCQIITIKWNIMDFKKITKSILKIYSIPRQSADQIKFLFHWNHESLCISNGVTQSVPWNLLIFFEMQHMLIFHQLHFFEILSCQNMKTLDTCQRFPHSQINGHLDASRPLHACCNYGLSMNSKSIWLKTCTDLWFSTY